MTDFVIPAKAGIHVPGCIWNCRKENTAGVHAETRGTRRTAKAKATTEAQRHGGRMINSVIPAKAGIHVPACIGNCIKENTEGTHAEPR
jgi:hypothetical protein